MFQEPFPYKILRSFVGVLLIQFCFKYKVLFLYIISDAIKNTFSCSALLRIAIFPVLMSLKAMLIFEFSIIRIIRRYLLNCVFYLTWDNTMFQHKKVLLKRKFINLRCINNEHHIWSWTVHIGKYFDMFVKNYYLRSNKCACTFFYEKLNHLHV